MFSDYNKKITWLIDNYIDQRMYETGMPTLSDAVKHYGFNLVNYDNDVSQQHLSHSILHELDTEIVIGYGSINFCKKVEKTDLFPGVYFKSDILNYHKYVHNYTNYMLNNDYYLLPFGDLSKRKINSSIFIRPDSGLKTFTGKTLTPDNFYDEISSLRQINRVDDSTLCVVSSVKNIDAEFRYFIIDGKVITGSEYRWDNILDVRIDTLPVCDELADIVASMQYQPNLMYVCDIAYTEGCAKIIELNSFSCSGTYACNTLDIVKYATLASIKDYQNYYL